MKLRYNIKRTEPHGSTVFLFFLYSMYKVESPKSGQNHIFQEFDARILRAFLQTAN